MKYFFTFSLIVLASISFAFGQIENPVKWNYTSKKIADKTYELQITATLLPTWHLYAQDAGEGPEPTSFEFNRNPLVSKNGKVMEIGTLIKEYDKNFNSTLKFYAKKVIFIQKIKVKTSASTVVTGSVNYMVCNDRKCLPPKKLPFSIKVG